jgi:hypothetical protein
MTQNTAEAPLVIVSEAGWLIMEGGESTVSVATALVVVAPPRAVRAQ